MLGCHIDQLTLFGNAGAVEDVEFGLAKGRSDLVLDHLDLGARSNHFIVSLNRADSADIDTHRRVELERVAAGSGLRIAEHYANLHSDLIDENYYRTRARNDRSKLAQRLRHQPRLQAHLWLAHFSF